MAFWGIEVKPGKPITHSCEKARGRLRISQATLGIGEATKKTVVQCNVGNRSPVLLCALLPDKTESCQLDLEFEEADDVLFSVIGPRSVYLTGYYVHQSHHSGPGSDSESYGVDIENSQSERSSYCSDDEKYEDSFIDDGELRVSPPSPVSSSKENDAPTGKKSRGRKLKKKFQVSESDNDVNSQESSEEDGFLLSVFKDKKTIKKTGEKNSQEIVETGYNREDTGICRSESKEKVDIRNVREREVELPLDDKVTQIKNEKCKAGETFEDVNVDKDKVLTDSKDDENMAETKIIMQVLSDLSKPQKKRKERSKKDEKTYETETDKDNRVRGEDEEKVDTSMNMKSGADCLVPSAEVSPNNDRKSKKRRNEHKFEGTCTNVDIPIDKVEQNTPKDLPAGTGDYQRHVDNQTEKTKKKMKKKSQAKGNRNEGVPNVTDNQEDSELPTADAIPIDKRTLSNGLIIELLANGAPDAKIAGQGKKVKVFFTAMLKESGHIFDSNVGKAACKFRLGDEKFIEGWNAGIDGMRVGEKRRITIPPSMGYGSQRIEENVPPNSWLVYDVELVGVRR